MPEPNLHVTELGKTGSTVAFCHGLFGQGRNWTQIGKEIAEDHRVLLVDMPNHGRSAWTDKVDYLDLADRVAELFSADSPVTLVGHSMGGKIAMVLALRRPELVDRLCVVDVSPVAYDNTREFAGYVAAMRGLDLSGLERRSDADDRLRDEVPNSTVRSFLLQNLRREDHAWRWQVNLDVLGDQLDQLGGWPEDRLADLTPYDGRVLWVGGDRSDYVREEYAEAMDRWFPRNRRVTIKGAGHWVHSEQPETFVTVLRRFLDA
ncbi:MAG TPA: alpha/beta fold hydrolase [Nocardioides sp.]|nr:alpha/beta fold hydrolase [Nocardioides sp.]